MAGLEEAIPGWAGIMAMAGVMLFVVFIIGIAFYIYTALAVMTTAKKIGTEPAWLAWIPVANFFLLPMMADMHWAWGFVVFAGLIPPIAPIAGLIIFGFTIFLGWKIAERRNKPGLLSLLMLIPLVGIFIYWGIMAWSD